MNTVNSPYVFSVRIVKCSVLLKCCKVTIYMCLSVLVPNKIKGISDHLKTKKMYKQAMRISSLYLISDYLKTHEVCIKAVEEHSWYLSFVTLKQALCDDTLGSKVPYQQ